MHKPLFSALLILNLGGVALISFTRSVAPTPAHAAANYYTSSVAVPTGYAASDVVLPSNLPVSVDCSGSAPSLPIGSESASQIADSQGHIYQGGSWQLTPTLPNAPLPDGKNNWYPKSASRDFASAPNAWMDVVGYVCTRNGIARKCRCSNQSCATSTWQLQAFKNEAAAPPPIAAFLNFPVGQLNLPPGQRVSLTNGTSLFFTTDADLEVVDDSNAMLWRSNTSANCSGSTNCAATLQADGNLVVYGPNGALWSSGTYNNNGGSLTFAGQAAYLTVRDRSYKVLWTSGGAASPGLLSFMHADSRALPIQSFLNALGVNVHMDQYEGDENVVLNKLKYLGVGWIRDHYIDDESSLGKYQLLGQNGIHFDMLDYSNDFSTLISHAEALANLGPGKLTSVEGPNEINNFSFSCDGSVWRGGWPNNNGPAADCFMKNYYAALKGDAKLGGVAMFDLTGGISASNAAQYGLLDIIKHADYGNIHPYAGTGEQPHNYYLAGLAGNYSSFVPEKTVITETGYTTSGPSMVSQRAQAILTLNGWLDAFMEGFHQNYVYELTDNAQEGYGLYDTNNSAKPVAVATHNLTTILADDGSPISSPGILNYSLSGLPSSGYKILLQKSSGVYELVVWNEPPIWNGADVAVTPTSVQVNLGGTRSKVSLYNPIIGTASTQQWTNVSSVTISLGAEALVLEITP